jgi:hypothetical protein
MSKNSGYFDLSGVFNVQQNYLTDLSNPVLYDNVNNSGALASNLLNLQNKVKTISKNYADTNTSSSQLLTQQNEMKKIVEDEQKRLEQKKFLVDQADLQEKRVALLNNTYRKRYTQYSKMVIIIIIALCIIIVLRFMNKMYESIPPEFIYSFYVVDIVGCIIIVTRMYADMHSRDPIDYDRIILPPPVITKKYGFGSSSPNFNNLNLLNDMGFCYQSNCCGPNTVFDQNSGRCIPLRNTSNTSMNVPVSVTQPSSSKRPGKVRISFPPKASSPAVFSIRPKSPSTMFMGNTPSGKKSPGRNSPGRNSPGKKSPGRNSPVTIPMNESFMPNLYIENELLPKSTQAKQSIPPRRPMETYGIYL